MSNQINRLFPLSTAANAALSKEFNKNGISPNEAWSALGAAAASSPPPPASLGNDIPLTGDEYYPTHNLNKIIEIIKRTIPKIENEYSKESKRREVGFKCIIAILIFAACCIGLAIALDITGIFAVSKGITAANAIVSLPAGIGLAAYSFQAKDKIENLRRDLILLYQIESASKNQHKRS